MKDLDKKLLNEERLGAVTGGVGEMSDGWREVEINTEFPICAVCTCTKLKKSGTEYNELYDEYECPYCHARYRCEKNSTRWFVME